MNSTPLWVPLVVAALGVIGTVVGTAAGVLITQRRSDRREDQAWQRERQREREQWAREDQLRTFDQRRESYVTFYESLKRMELVAYDFGMGLSEVEEMPFEWNMDSSRRLQQLRVFSSPEVMAAASAAYDACWWWGHLSTHGNDDVVFYGRKERYDRAELVLFEAIRTDLAVPTADVEGPLPGSGWSVTEDVARCDYRGPRGRRRTR